VQAFNFLGTKGFRCYRTIFSSRFFCKTSTRFARKTFPGTARQGRCSPRREAEWEGRCAAFVAKKVFAVQSRMAYRNINWYVTQRMYQHLRRRSQRPFQPPEGVSLYQHLQQLGLAYL